MIVVDTTNVFSFRSWRNRSTCEKHNFWQTRINEWFSSIQIMGFSSV